MIFIFSSLRSLFATILTVFICGSIFAQEKNILKAYSAPAGVLQNFDFTVKVRQPGTKWKDLPEYNIMVDRINGVSHSIENASMAYFDFSGTVEVSVTFNKGNINTSRIRPLSYNIPHRVSGRTISFVLDKPANLSLEINGDIFHNLHLFANPIESIVPDSSDRKVTFFGPGIHEIPSGALKIASGSTVYIAGGAILKGKLIIDNVENVKVFGRGMIDQSIKGAIRISNSKNIEIDGLFVTQCLTGGSNNVTIRNVKCISYYKWGDGMNVIASQNVLIDGVFNRNSDDCTTVYGTRLGFVGGCKNITMRNSTLWADVAHPILVGTHGNTPKPEVLEDLNYINIDILDHKEQQVDYQGCLSLNAGDSNMIRNVRFEDIRIEDFREGQLINIRVFFNAKYCTSPGRGVENVLFKNVNYNGMNAKPSIILGYDEQRKVRNIVFENLMINGTLYSDHMSSKPAWYKTSDMAGMFIGDHVDGVKFIDTKQISK